MKRSSFRLLALFLQILLYCIAGAYSAYSEELSWEYKDWKVDAYSEINTVMYIAHGNTIWGHQFGFIKRLGYCNQEFLWVSWSTSDDGINDYHNGYATLQFVVDGTRFQLEIPILSISKFAPGSSLNIIQFTNYEVGKEFKSILENAELIEVEITSPKELVSKLDIKTDTFSLNGFVASSLKAQEFCEELTVNNKLPLAYNDWKVEIAATGDKASCFYHSYGKLMKYNQFGFLSRSSNCHQDILYILWASFDEGVLSLVDTFANIQFTVNDTQFQLDIKVVDAYEIAPQSYRIMFSNFEAGQMFISLLENGDDIEIEITSPKELVDLLVLSADKFILDDFIAARKKAKELCAKYTGNK